MITVTEKCNLQCRYCYEEHKSGKVIKKELAILLIEEELNKDDEYDLVEIDFHGGEPFLYFDMIREICEFVWKRKYKKRYYFFATTNGTLMSDEVKEWLTKNKDRFICCLSIDGNRKMQNINRDNSFDSIDYNFFQKTWSFQDIKMTISQETLPCLAEGVIFLHQCGFKISENFAYGIDWKEEQNLINLSKELSKLIDYYVKYPDIKRCRLLSVPIEYLSYTFEDNINCSIGGALAVYDTDGVKYPCHFFQPNAIGREKSKKSREINFSDKSIYKDPECVGCGALNICPTCYGANYAATGNVALRDKSMCGMTKLSAKATGYLYYCLIERYGIKKLGFSPEKEKAVLLGIQKANLLEV